MCNILSYEKVHLSILEIFRHKKAIMYAEGAIEDYEKVLY